MSADRIEIDAELLRDQARAVADAASRVSQARQAASYLNLTGGAFGLMCQFLVAPAVLVSGAATSMMSQANAMLTREAAALRATADDFDGLEEDISAEMRRLNGGAGAL